MNKIRILALPLALALATTANHAATVNYSRIGSGESGFKQYWGLSDDEYRRYGNYMEITNNRYQNSSPLMVLSMIAEKDEEKIYYAREAARYEHEMVKREIHTAWLVSQSMSELQLTKEMQKFTDDLTGIKTLGYVPDDQNPEWRDGDTLVLLVDDSCLTAGCIGQFTDRIKAVKGKVKRQVVVNSKQPLSEAAQAIIKGWPETYITRYDPIEHHYLNANQGYNVLLHVRDRTTVNIVPDIRSSASAEAVNRGNSGIAPASGKTDAPITVNVSPSASVNQPSTSANSSSVNGKVPATSTKPAAIATKPASSTTTSPKNTINPSKQGGKS